MTQRPAVYGPLISTGEVDAHVRLLTEVFGMAVVDRTALDASVASDLFGAGIEAAQLTVLQTPGVASGAVLVSFEPASAETVRSYETRVDRDALKVIDFYAPDYEGAIRHARSLGYEVVEAQAEYELPEGVFREAHLWAPDNVVTAFLGGPAEFFADFAQVLDRRTSEVQSISAPLSDGQAAVDYYRAVFGWDVVYEYAIDDPSFAELLGIEEPLRLRSRNVGASTREPYVGLIDYGLPPEVGGSLLGRAVAPRRGLLGVAVSVEDLDATVAAAAAAVPGSAGPVCPVALAPFGGGRAAVLTPPHAVPHLVLERQG
ncbi:hypothetical protein [Nocardioides pantholopis]|uniref:hypothetical protein n=1 Tax=Nocardioides pantholopis TaxID=2483798 RepID=UPI000FD7C77E|nr:hypothetical protein [Nocardioides pantholopis]